MKRGRSALTLLLVLFVGVKLTEGISWSWLWVSAPIWVPGIAVFCIVTILSLFERRWRGWL
jgi:hypothetical protein